MLLDTVSVETFPIAQPTSMVGPTGGVGRANTEIEDHDDDEMHRIDAKGPDHRHEDRRAALDISMKNLVAIAGTCRIAIM